MKLRTRIVLGIVLVAVPVALLATGVERVRERDRAAHVVRERTLARIEGFDAGSCEADPEIFPDIDPRNDEDWLFGDAPFARHEPTAIRYFVYDVRGRPYRDDAPRLPPRAVRALGTERDVSFVGRRAGRIVERTLIHPTWRSPVCAAILVERPVPRRPPLLQRALPAILVIASAVFAVLVVVGPVVARIRRLTVAAEKGEARSIDDSHADELGDLARTFAVREATIEDQIRELESRERALREHLAATSHDVLLPITVVQGHLIAIDEAMARGAVPESTAVRGALEETHYVASLVRDLNADARLRSGMLVETEVDLGSLVDRVRARHAPIAERAGVALEAARPEDPVVVRGDPTLLEQMISNVVHNAVRYVDPGGHVAVVLETTGDRFEIRVLDDGPGVPESLLARLGDRGFRTDESRTRRPEGTGLGLYIVREVAGKHGYSVRFERGEPTGLVVRIEGTYLTDRTKAD